MSNELAHEEKGKVQARRQRDSEETAPRHDRPEMTQATRHPNPATVKQMQQAVGNAAVQRFLAQRQGDGPAEVDEETAGAIQAQRGQGSQLDADVAARAGATMGQDFGDVKVHTDGESNQLNQKLGARAFTTGKDIFFREGAYEPASSDGQRLIAHELTHVVQQGATTPAVQGKMMVNDPNDRYEAEADQVADAVMAQRQPEDEEEAVQMQAMEEEEEEAVQMQAMEEEEEETVQMQELEEEEEETVQMQELEDEELSAG